MENILEYLIPLIFIVSFLSMRSRKKQRKKRAEEAATQSGERPAVQKTEVGGVAGKLNKLLKDYYESDLKGAPEKKAEGTWVEDPHERQPPQREPEPWEDEDDFREQIPSMVETAEAFREEPVPYKTVVPEPVVQPVVEPEIVREVTAPSRPLPERLDIPSFKMSNMQKRDLRRAIVWSEILGPPKALRED